MTTAGPRGRACGSLDEHPQQVQALGATGQLDIQQDHVDGSRRRALRPEQRHRLVHRRGGPRKLEVWRGLDRGSDRGDDRGVVVDDRHGDGLIGLTWRSDRGRPLSPVSLPGRTRHSHLVTSRNDGRARTSEVSAPPVRYPLKTRSTSMRPAASASMSSRVE